jgi:hypothetical protein
MLLRRTCDQGAPFILEPAPDDIVQPDEADAESLLVDNRQDGDL